MNDKTKNIFTITFFPLLLIIIIILFMMVFYYFSDKQLEICSRLLETDGKSANLLCSQINSRVSSAFSTLTQLLIVIVFGFTTMISLLISRVFSLEKQIKELKEKLNV